MKYRKLLGHAMALFSVIFFVAVGGVDPRSYASARVRGILSLGDISVGGQLFGVLDPLARRIFASTYDLTLSNLGWWLVNDETYWHVVDLTSDDASCITGGSTEGSPVITSSVSTLAGLTSASFMSESGDRPLSPATDVQELPSSERQNLLVTVTSPAALLQRTFRSRFDPTAYVSSQSTIFSMINTLRSQNSPSSDWNTIAKGLAVVAGFDKTNSAGFSHSPVSVESGHEKNEFSNMCDFSRGTIEETPLLDGERLLPAQKEECSYPLSVTGDFNYPSSSLINLTIQSSDNRLSLNPRPCTFLCGRGKNYYKLPKSIFLSLLVAMVLVYLGYALIKYISEVFWTRLLSIFESSIEVGVCQELANAIPEKSVCNDLATLNAERPTRSVPPLGCVILTPSGPLSIDPRPSRQVSEEEDTSKYGLPVEALAYPRTPLGTLASCFAGSRPESPYNPLRKVTFADENDVFILPLVNLTKERNIRRRNSRRLQTAKAASDDERNTEAPIAKHRWF